MNSPLHNTPSPGSPKLLYLPATPAVRPKRRFKRNRKLGDDREDRPTIIPIRSPKERPVRFTRSGQPLQIWKAPPSRVAEPQPEKSTTKPIFRDFPSVYLRIMASLFAPFRHSH